MPDPCASCGEARVLVRCARCTLDLEKEIDDWKEECETLRRLANASCCNLERLEASRAYYREILRAVREHVRDSDMIYGATEAELLALCRGIGAESEDT